MENNKIQIQCFKRRYDIDFKPITSFYILHKEINSSKMNIDMNVNNNNKKRIFLEIVGISILIWNAMCIIICEIISYSKWNKLIYQLT